MIFILDLELVQKGVITTKGDFKPWNLMAQGLNQ